MKCKDCKNYLDPETKLFKKLTGHCSIIDNYVLSKCGGKLLINPDFGCIYFEQRMFEQKHNCKECKECRQWSEKHSNKIDKSY